MVIVDANVLVYAVNESMPRHGDARQWLEAALNGDEPVGLPWVSLLAFLRVSTLPALAPHPLSVTDALDVVDDWLGAHAATVPHPTTRHAALLRGFLAESGTGGNLATDAHLAALATEHGARLATFDRDFARFRGVTCITLA